MNERCYSAPQPCRAPQPTPGQNTEYAPLARFFATERKGTALVQCWQVIAQDKGRSPMSSRAALPDQYLCLCELSGFPHLRVRTQQTAGWADGRDRLIRIPNRWSSNPPTLLTRARCMVACLMSRPCVRCAENSEREKQRRRLRAMPDERSSSDIREWPCRIPCPYQV